jgi:hypothetical protein
MVCTAFKADLQLDFSLRNSLVERLGGRSVDYPYASYTDTTNNEGGLGHVAILPGGETESISVVDKEMQGLLKKGPREVMSLSSQIERRTHSCVSDFYACT